MMSDGLDADQAGHRRQQPDRLACELAKIDVHADGEEEHPEQQPLEGLDGRFDGLADTRFPPAAGRQRTRRAPWTVPPRLQRHRVPTITNRIAATNSSLVPVAATRRNSGRSSRRPTTTMKAERQRRLRHGEHDTVDDRAAHAVAEDGHEQEDRHDRHILREQDGEARAAGRGRHAALVGQDFDDDGGRGQGQARADDDRGCRRDAGQRGDAADHGRATGRPAGCRVRTPGGAW